MKDFIIGWILGAGWAACLTFSIMHSDTFSIEGLLAGGVIGTVIGATLAVLYTKVHK